MTADRVDKPENDGQFADLVIVGGGAAGLATAIFAARRHPDRSILLVDGAKKLGAKILVSGGGRCNVTNETVTSDDFQGGSPHIIRRILNSFTAAQSVEFFREIGVSLHRETHGKLFPDTHDAHTVLDAMMGEARRLGVTTLTEHRVSNIVRHERGFAIETSGKQLSAATCVLATGGRSLPKTGSDGGGYELARRLGHSIVPITPGLVPLVLEGDFHIPLSGIAHEVELILRSEGEKPIHVRGSMLWTHFGISGPAVLDLSRFWLRARLNGKAAELTANFLPGETFEKAEVGVMELARTRPRASLHTALEAYLPSRVAGAVLERIGLNAGTVMAQLLRDDRRKLVRALLSWPLSVRDSRGYNHAEVTAGGVPLDEIVPVTLASRKCPGLYLVGEILDVDGRIGGFNFQWSWSTAWAAASGMFRHDA